MKIFNRAFNYDYTIEEKELRDRLIIIDKHKKEIKEIKEIKENKEKNKKNKKKKTKRELIQEKEEILNKKFPTFNMKIVN